MSEQVCNNCKHWSTKEKENRRGYRVCLRWILSYGNETVPREGATEGQPIFTPLAFGCNAFEEKQKGPFYTEQCPGTKDFFIMANFDGLLVTIGNNVPENEAKGTARLLNEQWFKREKGEGNE